MWSDLGLAPGSDVREVTVIGPGHGESVVVHLGDGEWMVIDSCALPNSSGESAPLAYLQSIGVDVGSAVKTIVVSHWDDDHVRGISDLVGACKSATFCCSTALTKREFANFVEVLFESGATTGRGNVSEFRRCLDVLDIQGRGIFKAFPGRQLSSQGKPLVRCWSPSDLDDMAFLEYVALNYPMHLGATRRAIPGSPNLTSIVISIEWDDTSVLLGADMLACPDDRRGWGAIVGEAGRIGYTRAELVKIPHHGSEGAHDERMWEFLLVEKPISVIAPFGRGPERGRPPKSTDVARVAKLSSETYLTARRDSNPAKKKSLAVTRSLRESGIRITPRHSGIGMVRMRKAKNDRWNNEVFGSAVRVK